MPIGKIRSRAAGLSSVAQNFENAHDASAHSSPRTGARRRALAGAKMVRNFAPRWALARVWTQIGAAGADVRKEADDKGPETVCGSDCRENECQGLRSVLAACHVHAGASVPGGLQRSLCVASVSGSAV